MLLASDISSVPAELIKHLLTLVLAFGGMWLAHKKLNQGSKDQPVNIAQPLSVQKHDDSAKKSELLRIETTLKSFSERVDGLAEQMNAQFAAMTKAGQDRAAAIAQNIDEEVGALRTSIGELAEALHEKINKALVTDAKHSAEISGLQAGEYRHNTEIARIQEHIADLLSRPQSPHRKQ